MNNSVNIKNRKAKYDYHVLNKYVSGIVLSGNEIKSIRQSKASLNNCYCEFDTNNELYIINMNIDEYSNSNEYSPSFQIILSNPIGATTCVSSCDIGVESSGLRSPVGSVMYIVASSPVTSDTIIV